MSIGFLLKNRHDSVVWRGPKKTGKIFQHSQLSVAASVCHFRNNSMGLVITATISQFLTQVDWKDLDYLIVDTPPGTSDEHITVIEKLRFVALCCLNSRTKLATIGFMFWFHISREFHCDGAILVTTPQEVAIEDVRKEYTLCCKTKIPVLGIVENMSGYLCSHCKVQYLHFINQYSASVERLINALTCSFRNAPTYFQVTEDACMPSS